MPTCEHAFCYIAENVEKISNEIESHFDSGIYNVLKDTIDYNCSIPSLYNYYTCVQETMQLLKRVWQE